VKILFSMRHAGALRNFASTIEALAARGHQVHLAFMVPEKGGDRRLIDHLGQLRGVSAELVPASRRESRHWLGLARALRNGRDYVRYGTTAFADAPALRERAGSRVSPQFRALMRLPLVRTQAGVAGVASAIAALDRVVPADDDVVRYVAAQQPDLLLLTPLIDLASDQGEYVKAAKQLGVRTALCVHSWDNLTTKGLIGQLPDRVLVWNAHQKREAIEMHGCRADQVVVTGAPVYDQWFDRKPSQDRAAFCATVGLRADRPIVLYLCSSPFISPGEERIVLQWAHAIRQSADPALREAGLLVRPHPRQKLDVWGQLDMTAFGNAVVWPTSGSNPVDPASRNGYFDSLYHAAACVGINTSAQIEASIVGRPLHGLRVPEYSATQEGTLHFRYLLAENGGPVRFTESFDAHVAAVAETLADPTREQCRLRAFVESFVRPNGIDRPATPQVVAAVETAGAIPAPQPWRPGVGIGLARHALYPVALARSAVAARTLAARRAVKVKGEGRA
jgi:hypothetical protein